MFHIYKKRAVNLTYSMAVLYEKIEYTCMGVTHGSWKNKALSLLSIPITSFGAYLGFVNNCAINSEPIVPHEPVTNIFFPLKTLKKNKIINI